MNRRHKILYVLSKNLKGQYIENSFFKKSVTIWNTLEEDYFNYKKILTDRKAEKDFKN